MCHRCDGQCCLTIHPDTATFRATCWRQGKAPAGHTQPTCQGTTRGDLTGGDARGDRARRLGSGRGREEGQRRVGQHRNCHGPAPPPATDNDRARPAACRRLHGRETRLFPRKSTEDCSHRLTSVCHKGSGVLPLVKHPQSPEANTQHVTHKPPVCVHKPESSCATAAGTPTSENTAFPEMKTEKCAT